MNEKMIEKHMSILGISREEAIALIQEDEKIDRMTKASDINADLNEEQKKASKSARQADRKPTVFKFDTSNRKRKENNDKRFLIELLKSTLCDNECDVDVTNVEREMLFNFKGVKYKLVLSQPRS